MTKINLESNHPIRAVCLMGPTAAGKTALACACVPILNAEIISIDSAMIYRDMNIGTAKPDAIICQQAPHHLIDICDPCDNYSVAQCREDVLQLCAQIHQRGRMPLLVGGSMMYFRALQQGLSKLPSADATIRAQLLSDAKIYGWEILHKRLTEIDPISAARIHPADTQRLQRALEVYAITGKSLSACLAAEPTTQNEIQWINIILMPEDRFWLHERIAQRFDEMLALGFIDEVAYIVKKWSLTPEHPALRAVGYRQVYNYLQGSDNLTVVREKGIAATRQLAKRQLTWLRHWPDGYYYAAEKPPSPDDILALMLRISDNHTF